MSKRQLLGTELKNPANDRAAVAPRWLAMSAVAVLCLGILGYLIAQLGVVTLPMRDRSVPVEADDAYTYMIKAEQMQTCFLQDCPALEALRQQLTESAKDNKAEWLRYREYSRAFLVYHPLHSLVMIGLSELGLSWEQAYNVIGIAGVILIGLAIAYWLYQLLGAGAAGIAMALMALTLFSGQGLHYIVPSNLALGIAIFTWGVIAARRNRSIWFVLFGVIAMIGMHTTGRLYALATLALYYLLAAPVAGGDRKKSKGNEFVKKKPFSGYFLAKLTTLYSRLSRQQWILFGIALFIVVLAFILPIFIAHPELSVRADPPPANWKVWHGYRDNLTQALKIITDWLQLQTGILAAILLLAVGAISTPKERRATVGIFFAVLGFLLAISLLLVLPRYPAEAFARVWIPIAILLFGLLGQAIWAWFVAVLAWISRLLHHKMPELIDPAWILSSAGWLSVALVVLGIFITQLFIQRLTAGTGLLLETTRIMTWKQNTELDSEQPARLLEQGCAPVLYLDEVPMHFYFSRGAMNCPAVYYPALEGTRDADTWIEQNKDLQYIVGWNPAVESGLLTGGSSMALMPGDRLQMQGQAEIDLDQVSLYLDNPGAPLTLTVIPLKNGAPVDAQVMKLDLPGNQAGWYSLTGENAEQLSNIIGEGFILQIPDPGHRVLLRGLRLAPEDQDESSTVNRSQQELFWPWDQQVTLLHTPKDAPDNIRTIEFDTSKLAKLVNRPVHILADWGDTFLAEIDRR